MQNLSCENELYLHDNKQLLDEVEHGIVNYQNRGLCYLQKPNSIIVLLHIFQTIFEANRSAIFAKF